MRGDEVRHLQPPRKRPTSRTGAGVPSYRDPAVSSDKSRRHLGREVDDARGRRLLLQRPDTEAVQLVAQVLAEALAEALVTCVDLLIQDNDSRHVNDRRHLDGDLQPVSARGEPASEFSLPSWERGSAGAKSEAAKPHKSGTVQLDAARIAAIQGNSERAAALLADIFDGEEEPAADGARTRRPGRPRRRERHGEQPDDSLRRRRRRDHSPD